MQILCVDVGTGTQDVFLYDTNLGLENGFKMIVPSPTMIIRRRVLEATRMGQPLLLTGVTMGGGPSHWAVEDHLAAGYAVYATPAAARSFNDDLDEVAEMGIRIVSEDEAARLGSRLEHLELKDFDYPALRTAFSEFGIGLDQLALVAVAVFDHGAAPPGYSDRKFRFEYIEKRIKEHNQLSAFAYPSPDIPESMTRMQSVTQSAGDLGVPLMVMDTAPAAILGAGLDQVVRSRSPVLIANVGNFHTLAFRLGAEGIEGVFEHHTGLMTQEKLDHLLASLADGSLTDADVFYDQGHGARVFTDLAMDISRDDFGVVVVGPRRRILESSSLRPYFAAPFGDMMLGGCFGMVAAAADLYPDLTDTLTEALFSSGDDGHAPWEY